MSFSLPGKFRGLGVVLSLAGVFSTAGLALGQPEDAKEAPAAKSADQQPGEAKTEKPGEAKTEAAPGDDKPADAPAAGSPAEQFKAVYARWTAIDKRLNEIAANYGLAPEDERAKLKAEYTQLVADSQTVLAELRAAAEAAFAAEPNKDADVVRTLIGLVHHLVNRDEYEQALELSNKLFAGNCEEPILYAIAGVAAFNIDDYETAEKFQTVAKKAGRLDPNFDRLPQIAEQKKAWEEEKAIREKEAKADDLPRVKLETSKGTIVVELFENEAPGTVGNFISLVEKKFYDGLTFHRVLPGFVAQGGDPTGDGTGGPGYKIYCECDKPDARLHFRGSLSMAHAGPNTGGSQFFLTFQPTLHLNHHHTVFGRVIEGFDVLAKIQRRDPSRPNPPPPDKIVKAEVIRKRNHEYKPNKVE
jgi:cyclophilin family peptidyl-prolyl cis-trans isomerase